MYNLDDTIVAISSPIGEGGIGIVRLSGKDALPIADRIFMSKDGDRPSQFKTYTIHYGHIVRRASCAVNRVPQTVTVNGKLSTVSEVIDEILLTVMRAPKSYTKEDVVEINCHGGIIPMRKVMDLVVSLGARIAEPGEFTKRAFLNGRLDLSQAEAVLDIIRSKTESSLKIAIDQLEGAFSEEVNSARNELLELIARVEADIDFSDEDIESVSKKDIKSALEDIIRRLDNLVKTSTSGMILKEGVLCVICGKPNVGKSSLMNALLRRNRVIVTPVPGTTRDAIEETVSIDGIPVRVTDTAGIVKTGNPVEKEGVLRSKSYLKKADLVIFMLDRATPFSKRDKEIYDVIDKKEMIVIANKSDLKRKLDAEKAKGVLGSNDILEVSILKKKNIDKLEKAITEKIWHGKVRHPEGTLVTNLRHKRSLVEALDRLKKAKSLLDKGLYLDLLAQDLKEAVYHLGTIIGKSVDTGILDRIFSKFCIGK